MSKQDLPYEVGYQKPPKRTRFQPGQSGNPRGRPKGRLSTSAALERELNQPVTIKENGVTRTITKRDAILKQLVNKAASGDPKTLQILLSHLQIAEEAASSDPVSVVSPEIDDALMAGISRRLRGHVLEEGTPDAAS